MKNSDTFRRPSELNPPSLPVLPLPPRAAVVQIPSTTTKPPLIKLPPPPAVPPALIEPPSPPKVPELRPPPPPAKPSLPQAPPLPAMPQPLKPLPQPSQPPLLPTLPNSPLQAKLPLIPLIPPVPPLPILPMPSVILPLSSSSSSTKVELTQELTISSHLPSSTLSPELPLESFQPSLSSTPPSAILPVHSGAHVESGQPQQQVMQQPLARSAGEPSSIPSTSAPVTRTPTPRGLKALKESSSDDINCLLL